MIKRNYLLASALFCSAASFADVNLSFFSSDNVSVRVVSSEEKTMTFGAGKISFDGENYEMSKIDSIVVNPYVSVTFDGDKVVVSNPFDSVNVEVSDANVVINSEYLSREIKYKFSGSSKNGSVLFSSLYKSKFELDNLDLTSAGVNPPICISTKKNTEVKLVGQNSLANSKADTVGATMRSRGQFEIKGDGSLNITSVVGHGIQSSDYVDVKNGKITITAESDGIHVNDYYMQSGGDVVISTKADGVDVGEGYAQIDGGTFTVTSDANESRGIRCTFEEGKENTADININGGKVDIRLGGKGSRGLKADGNVTVKGGELLVLMTGSTYISGTNPNADTTVTCGVKADKTFLVEDGLVSIICGSSAKGSRCLQADAAVTLNGGATVVHQNSGDKLGKKPNVIKTNGNLRFKSSANLFVKSVSGVKTFNIDGKPYWGGSEAVYEEEDVEDDEHCMCDLSVVPSEWAYTDLSK